MVTRCLCLFWRDRRGQDMIEYALMAAFLSVAVAAFFPTDIAPNISSVFSKVVHYLNLSVS
jgi:Flp pilus assembly pilin Flp